jgi:hypothetical protein
MKFSTSSVPAQILIVILTLSPASTSFSQGTITAGNKLWRFNTLSTATTPASADFQVPTPTDHVFASWWYYRILGDNYERRFPSTPTSQTYLDSTATINWSNVDGRGFAARLAIALRDVGGSQSVTAKVMTITNNTASSMTIDIFNYIDIDLAGTAGSDAATLVLPNEYIRVTEGSTFADFRGVGANAYEVRTYAANLRGALHDTTTLTNLNNTGLPFTPGDFTGAFQWQFSIPAGDSVKVRVFVTVNEPAAMMGTYTVGVGGRFATLADAFSELMSQGVGGPITLSLIDTVYDAPGKPFGGLTEASPSGDQLDMMSAFGDLSAYYAADSPDTIGALTLTGPISGVSSTNTVTIRPAAGRNVRIVGNGAHLIRFVDASWITIDGINAGGTSLTMRSLAGAGLLLDGNSDNITIQNVNLSCSPNFTAIVMGILSGNAPDNCLIQNNYIGTSFNAVFMINGTQPPVGVGNRVLNNRMGSPADTIIQAGVILQNGMNTTIAGNWVQNIRRSNAGNVRGISLQTKHLNTHIYNNIVHSLFKGGTTTGVVSGINANGAAADTTRLKVYNNMIYDHDYASTITTGTIVGINVGVGINDTIAYNSVDIGGVDVTAITTSALTVASAPTNAAQFWRNNIGVNRRMATGTGRAIAFLANTTTGQYSTNYNDLYVPTQAGSHVAAVTTTNYTTLADWQTTGRDLNSVSVMPNFVAPHLHIDTTIATPLNGGATPVASITTDIDGQSRHATMPDIGADEFDVVVGVEDGEGLPATYALDQNYPNPFNPVTQIKYALPKESFVTLKVYNVLGQEVITLVNQVQTAGYVTVTWDGRSGLGHAVGSGMYFYRIEARSSDGGETFVQVKKMIMVK